VTDTASPAVFNPFEPGYFAWPYAQYAAVREREPVHMSPIGQWMLFRYDDCFRLLRDPSLSVDDVNAAPTLRMQMFEEIAGDRRDRGDHSMLNSDPPDHTRLRKLVSQAFTPRAIEALRPRVRELVDQALDAVAGAGEMDVIADLAFPLPFTVISEMLGMPEADRLQLRAWSHAMTKTLDPILSDDEVRAAMDGSDHMAAYVADVIEWKRANPADDMLSALIHAEEDGDRLSTDELLDQVSLLYVAGHETTVNLIGNGTLRLLEHPDQLTALRADPGLDRNAVEELLRFDSPVQFSRRITLQETEVGGHVIEPGSFVLCCLGSANHDPAKWGADADELRLDRADAEQHLSFGSGMHRCLGAALAKLEGQEAVGRLIRRFPDLAPMTDTADWSNRIVLRGLSTLRATFTPTA
jgi:cytochrome P450